MIRRIQQLPRAQRTVIFALFIVGGLLLIAAVTVALILLTLNTGRDQSVALIEGVTAREFAVLPDDDAYPASVAVAADGTVYTGSYATGAVWSIAPDGTVTEIPGTRDAVGAVSGLAVGLDGVLYVVDQADADPLTFGGDVKQVRSDGEIVVIATPEDERGFVLPDDITVDAQGRFYVSDRGRAEVWRFEPDGSGGVVWWVPPEAGPDARPAPTGLAYDPAHEAIIISDSNLNALYRVPIAGGEGDLLYAHRGQEHVPGFDGVTVGPEGTVYVAALAQNGLVRLNEAEMALEYIAGVFRGLSDVAYHDGQIYAANFDSFSLIVPLVRPRLPFALDVVTLAQD